MMPGSYWYVRAELRHAGETLAGAVLDRVLRRRSR